VSGLVLPRRAPREVYRVYTEDEYLAGVDERLPDIAGLPADAQNRLRRIAGAALLMGACGAVGGVLALGGFAPATGPTRRMRLGGRAVRGHLVAANSGSSREEAKVKRPVAVRSPGLGAGLPALARAVRTRAADAGGRPALRAAAVHAATNRGVLVVAEVAHPEYVRAEEAAQVETPPEVNVAYRSPSPPARPAEFGFER
jgi:hypothetical protein